MILSLSALSYAEDKAFYEITGSHRIANDPGIKDGTHIFILRSVDGGPMPEGSSDGLKRISVGSGEDFSFGQIEFTKKGIFSYTVSRELNQSEDLKEDDSVYDIVITVLNEGDPFAVIKRRGDQGKLTSAQYRDTYIKREAVPVKTGDTTDIYVFIALFIICLISLFIYSTYLRKER